MKNKYAYKVLTTNNNNFVSFYMLGNAKVEYNINKWAQAPECLQKLGYYLLVFDSLENIESFLGKIRQGIFIFKCKIKNIINPLPKSLDIRGGSFSSLYESFKNNNFLEKWPKGTIMVKQVKLIEQV